MSRSGWWAAGCCLWLAASGPASALEPALTRAIDAPTRSAQFVARDRFRHPGAELAFFGVTPASDVVEIWPGGGYWTQILAPLLRAHGTYTVALGDPDGDRTEQHFAMPPKFKAMLDAHPELYDRIKISTFGDRHLDFAPAGSADFVLTFRNLHNWMKADDAPAMLSAIARVLKPGGILGIEDHASKKTGPQDPRAEDGYVQPGYARALIEKAGFTYAGSSDIDANPKDTTDWPQGVWTLPPSYAMGATDHAKYAAIGEGNNFVMKFRKN